MMSPARLVEETTGVLEGAGIESAPREALWIVEAATGLSTAQLMLAEAVRPDAVERAARLAERRASGEPLQYVTGVAGFRRLELAVGPGVLIPRPETEVVAGVAMDRLPRDGIIVDVGTGCGAIALAVADERPDANVYGTESSTEALSWAEKNRGVLKNPVELINCDLLSGLPPSLVGRVDVVVCNPPYVAPSERAILPPEVVDYEPPDALFASGDGLDVIRRVVDEARQWLAPGGWLVLEIGIGQERTVEEMMLDAGYEQVVIRPDLAGRPRIAEGSRSEA